MNSMPISELDSDMALQVFLRLQVANPSGLIRPPVYSVDGGPFAPLRQTRYLQGETVSTVLLDSVESQANRQENLLYRHAPLPDLRVELFDGRQVSQYEAPGRILDPIFREALWDGPPFVGTPFHKTPLFQAIAEGGEVAEQVLFVYSPLTLVYGGWLSFHQEISPEKAPKWPRLVAVEILGLEPEPAHRTSSRLDPLSLPGDLTELPESIAKNLEEQGKKGRLSEAGLGRLPPTASPLDVAVKEAVLVGAVSLVGFRNLRLPQEAQEALLALALLGLALQHREGYRLRSGADLVPERAGCLTVRALPSGKEVCLEVESLKRELDQRLEQLRETLPWPESLTELSGDRPWRKKPILLKASEGLNELYKKGLEGKAEKAKNKGKGKGKQDGEDK
jgi:CRISPR-associated protein Csb1